MQHESMNKFLYREKDFNSMYTQLFEEPPSIARVLQIEAMHGYLYAIDKLKNLALYDPEAAFRLAVFYFDKKDRLNAGRYFNKTVELEENLNNKKYTAIINIKYSLFICKYDLYKSRSRLAR